MTDDSLSHLLSDSSDDIVYDDVNDLDDSGNPNDSFSVSNRSSRLLPAISKVDERSTDGVRRSASNELRGVVMHRSPCRNDMIVRGVRRSNSKVRGVTRSASNDVELLGSLLTESLGKASSSRRQPSTSSISTSTSADRIIYNDDNKVRSPALGMGRRRVSMTGSLAGRNSSHHSRFQTSYSRRSSVTSSYHDSMENSIHSIYINPNDMGEISSSSMNLLDDESETHECVADFDSELKSSIQKLVETNSMKRTTNRDLQQKFTRATPTHSPHSNTSKARLSNYLPDGYSSISPVNSLRMLPSTNVADIDNMPGRPITNHKNNITSQISSSNNHHPVNNNKNHTHKIRGFQRRNSSSSCDQYISKYREEKQRKLDYLLQKATHFGEHMPLSNHSDNARRYSTSSRIHNENDHQGNDSMPKRPSRCRSPSRAEQEPD